MSYIVILMYVAKRTLIVCLSAHEAMKYMYGTFRYDSVEVENGLYLKNTISTRQCMKELISSDMSFDSHKPAQKYRS